MNERITCVKTNTQIFWESWSCILYFVDASENHSFFFCFFFFLITVKAVTYWGHARKNKNRKVFAAFLQTMVLDLINALVHLGMWLMCLTHWHSYQRCVLSRAPLLTFMGGPLRNVNVLYFSDGIYWYACHVAADISSSQQGESYHGV